MLIYALIAGLIVVSALGVAAVAAAAYFYGENRILTRSVSDLEIRDAVGQLEMAKWQNKLLEKAGIGPLVRAPQPESSKTPAPPPRRIVSASQAINEMKDHDNKGLHSVPTSVPSPVPSGIANKFLDETRAAAAAGNN